MKLSSASSIGVVLYFAALTASGELVPAGVHDYDYVVTNGTVTITRYTGPGGNITVPSTIENLPVTVIGYRAFNPAFEDITSLTERHPFRHSHGHRRGSLPLLQRFNEYQPR